MRIVYPINCNTEASRLSFCYRLDELLRLRHNAMGQKYRDGLITEAEWNIFLKNEFEPKSMAIHQDINVNREIAGKSVFWLSANIDTSIDTKTNEVV